MKKGLIFATTLAMALGVGVAVGAHQGKAAEVKAATNSVTLAGSFNSWSTTANPLTLSGDYWTIEHEFAANDTFKIVVNGNAWVGDGDGVHWCEGMGSEGKGQNFKVLTAGSYVIKAASTIGDYDDKSYGVFFEKGAEPEPEEHTYYYSLNGGEPIAMVEHDGTEVKTVETSFSKGDVISFLKDEDEYAVSSKEDGAYTNVYAVEGGLKFAVDYDHELYLETNGGYLWAGQFTPGYYLAGAKGEWNTKLAIPAHKVAEEDPAYVVEDVELDANDMIKFVQYPNNHSDVSYINANQARVSSETDVPFTVITEEGLDYGNLKVTEADTYDIYYDPTGGDGQGWYSIEYSNPHVAVYTMQIDDKSPVTLVMNESNHDEYMTAEVFDFKAGEQVKFFKDGVVIDAGLKEDEQLTKLFVANAEEHILEFAEAFEGKPVINVKTNKVWGGQFTPGYYLAGVAGEWNPKLAVPAHKVAEEDPAYVAEEVAVAKDAEVKFIYAPNDDSGFVWYNADKSRISSDSNVPLSANEEEGESYGNLIVGKAGTFDFYYNPTGGDGQGWYSVEDPSYSPVYTVQVGEHEYELEPNLGTEYKIKGYEAINLAVGEEVTVLKDGVELEYSRKMIGNNNLDANFEIIANGAGQVYVDISAKTIFAGGLDFGGYHVLHNGNYVHMTQNTDPLDPSYLEYYTELISFKKDEVVRFIDTTAEFGTGYAVVFDIDSIDPISEPGISVVGEGEAARLVVQEDVNLSVYLKLKSGADQVYFGSVSPEVALAKEFAENFNDDLEGVCVYYNKDKDPSAALIAMWGEQAEAFDDLDEKVQAVLKAATSHDSINEIAEFIAKYEYIAGKYGDKLGEDYDFLAKGIVPLANFGEFDSLNYANATTIIVITIAATSALAFTLLLVFKKRKQK